MKRLDEYIDRLNTVEPSPYLPSRIIARIEAGRQRKAATLWQSVAVAASVAIVVMIGITLGNGMKSERYLTINDNQIENFSIITSDDTE